MGDERFFALRPLELLVRDDDAAQGRRAVQRAWATDSWAGGDTAAKLADGLVLVARAPKRKETPLQAGAGPGAGPGVSASLPPRLRLAGGRARPAARAWSAGESAAPGPAADCQSPCGGWPSMARDYCGRTTLHGLKYVGDQELHVVERLFWFIIFVVAVFAAIYYIIFLYDKWKENPVIVSLSPMSTKINDIPFPAVTVCSMNRAKKTVAESILQQGRNDEASNMDYALLKDLCDFENSTKPEDENITYIWETVQSFLIKVGQPCHEMLQTCKYGGNPFKCSELFNPSITDEGICCSFNKVQLEYLFRNPRDLSDLNVTFPGQQVDWTPERGYPLQAAVDAVPFRPAGTGTHLGLSLVLDAHMDEYFCSTTASVGFKILLHSAVETPKISNMGNVVSPGAEVRLVVRPRISFATAQLRDIPVAKRQCYFSGENPLKFYRTYTQRNCALECEANYTLQQCRCVLPYMPKSSKTRICGQREERCAVDARKKMEMYLDTETEDSKNEAKVSKCHCLPGCSEINYRSYISSSILAPEYSMSNDYVGTTNITYFKKNMAIVHIFFVESQFTSHLKGELFGFTEFLSSTGGLLGLFMGFSFMSLVEVIYYITLRLWCTVYKSRRHIHLASEEDTHQTYTVYPFTQ